MKKRNVMILIILLVIGFASVSTTLIINGNIGIGSDQDDFNVIFTNVKLNEVNRNEFIDKETKQTINFETDKLTTIAEEAILDYEVTNTSRLYDAEVVINCIVPENEYITVEYEPKSMTIVAGDTETGKITARLVKASTEDSSINIKCTLNANAVERDILGQEYKESPWKITEDNDSNGELSKGDLITLGTESFYVYDIEGDKVKAIAQYNLYVGHSCTPYSSSCTSLENSTGLQSYLANGYENSTTEDSSIPWIGGVPFKGKETINNLTEGQKQTDYTLSDIKTYVDAYADKLNELDGEVQMARLITKEELEAAGCDSENITCKNAPVYLWSTSYWTMSPASERDIWAVFMYNSFEGEWVYDVSWHGVRPVIEISKSLF